MTAADVATAGAAVGAPAVAVAVDTDCTVGLGADEARRAGRPRSEERHQAILEAALTALVEEGYGGMSIERVAARAGAGKATVYRRWRNKAELIVEAMERHTCADIPLVDTGDLRADMRTFLGSMADVFNGNDGALMAAFVAERMRHPELQAEFDRMFVTSRRQHLRHLVASAVERGELPAGTDVELLADVGTALLWQQVTVRSGRITSKLVDRVVDQFYDV